MDFGFSHYHHLHLSFLPWHMGSFVEKLDTAYKMMFAVDAGQACFSYLRYYNCQH